ncbi:NAD(P)-dependent oxidoreductase [Pseudopelagicola sp. nBUS_20]|uniref:NAD(P)-dependent oxidoreductase n=1 Tax=Pseudopelagicola sp. nBUS_20 TaxID=3395317 RepID=UPI003EBB7C61
MSKQKIGFIGLGLMGGAMVSRLQDKGYDLQVMGNRDRTELDKAVARGATEAASASDVAANSDIIMLCMGTSDHVESRMRGDEGVIAGIRPGTVIIDFGTSLPASTQRLACEVAAAGGTYLDAPIGRTPTHALDGQLNLMCSGDKIAFESVLPVLNDLGENIFHLGDVGSGHKIKLINNFFGQVVANSLGEAFTMADITGVDRQKVFDVMFAGPLGSPFMEFFANYALSGDASKLAFSIENATKDVGYYVKMAEDAGAPSVMAQAPLEMMRQSLKGGMGDKLVPELLDHYLKHYGRG